MLAKQSVSETMSETQQLFQIRNVLTDSGDVNKIPPQICLMCYAVFNSVDMLRRLGVPKEFFGVVVALLCSAINGFSLSACSDIMRINIVSKRLKINIR